MGFGQKQIVSLAVSAVDGASGDGGLFALHSLVFLTAFYVGKWFPPRKRVDYIVVLGSGLIDGKVPPLLAGRVDAALRYAARQKKKNRA